MNEDPTATPKASAYDAVEHVRPEIRALKAYHLDRSPVPHKLDQNEMPYELPRFLKRRIVEGFLNQPWSLYPDFHGAPIREALAEQWNWPMEGTLVGNGSGELISAAFAAWTKPGDEILSYAPSFSLYKQLIARAGSTPHFIPAGDDLRIPIDALEAEIERDPTRLTVLCTPNNPTGEAIEPEVVDRLAGKLQAPLVLDAAYLEFCDYDYRPLLDRHPHLMVFGTLSKAWAMAALRVGYVIADPKIVNELVKVKRPYNLNIWSVLAAAEILRHPRVLKRRVDSILGRRPQWAEMLRGFGFQVLPSQANFLLVLHPEADRIEAGLEERGIRIRKLGGHPALRESLRISVGNGRDLRATRRALEDILQGDAT